MECWAVIPARGASKGIPRKNLQLVGGTPLVVRSIRAVQEARRIARVLVSTDDEEIAETSREAGAEVVMRPAELADDVIMPDHAVWHCLDTLRREEGHVPDLTCFIQCTSPLTRAEDLDAAVRICEEEKADCVFAVAPCHYFLWRRNAQGKAEEVNHDALRRIGRQELEPEFRETGAFYVMNTRGFLKTHHRFFGKILLFEMPASRSIDIDDHLNLEIADFLVRK